MSPVEPRPVVMGTMGAPSTDGTVTLLRFFPRNPLAFNPDGVKKLPAAPIAARNERRLQPSFIFGDSLLFDQNYFCVGAPGAFTTLALPTISIRESPGIHSTAMHARDGDFPGEK